MLTNLEYTKALLESNRQWTERQRLGLEVWLSPAVRAARLSSELAIVEFKRDVIYINDELAREMRRIVFGKMREILR